MEECCHLNSLLTNTVSTVTFLEFLGIKTAVENYIRQSEIDLGTDPLPLTNCVMPFNVKLILRSKIGSQDMYRLLTYNTVTPKSQTKWNQIFLNTDLNWKTIYTIPKVCCKKNKTPLVSI